MTTTERTCSEAVHAIRGLRRLAREIGLPPTTDAELGRLELAVEAAARAVRFQAAEAERIQAERDQLRLL